MGPRGTTDSPIQCVAMSSRHRRWTVLAAVVAGIAVSPGLSSAALADGKDVDVVYCLSRDQRARLVETAVILELAVAASPGPAPVPAGRPRLEATAPRGDAASLEDWRRDQGAAFTRACSALIGADRVPQPAPVNSAEPPKPSVSPLLSAALGALLSGIFALSVGKVGAGRTQAAALRAAKKNFDREAQALIEARAAWVSGPKPKDEKLRDARIELGNQLEEIQALHPGWREPGAVRKAIDSSDLVAALLVNQLREGESKVTRLDTARTAVHDIMLRVERLAVAVQRPLRPHYRMRRVGGTR